VSDLAQQQQQVLLMADAAEHRSCRTIRRVPGKYSWLGVLLVGLICLLRVSAWVAASFWGYGSQLTVAPVTPILATGRDHLLLYAFSYTDPEFLHNLEYFIRNAVIGDTVADHIIIVQEGPDLEVRQLQQQQQQQTAITA
jgi:hypothetical protein